MDLNAIKNRLAVLTAPKGEKKEKVDYSTILWKPKSVGKYQIRIVNSKFDKSNPFKEVFIHYGLSKFPIYALTNWGEKDPIVEFVKSLRKSSDKDDWTMASKLNPKTRIFAPVIVRGEEEKGVRLWEFGNLIYKQLLGIADDEDYGDFTDVAEGRDFTIDATLGEVGGRQGITCALRVKPKTSPLSDDPKKIEFWLENQPNILEVQRKMTFDQLKEILANWLNPENSNDEPAASVDTNEDEDNNTPPFTVDTSKASKANKFDKLFEEEEEK